jgi:hypothetical protein
MGDETRTGPSGPRGWIETFRTLAARGLEAVGADGAEREAAHLAPGFARWRRARRGGGGAAPAEGAGGALPDQRLWALVASDPPAAIGLVESWRGEGRGRGRTDAGSLVPQKSLEVIEVWTECEMSALQALVWLSLTTGRDDLLERAERCLRWRLEHLQPDNATNRPWTVHLCAHLAARDGSAEAAWEAQTLLHNCQVGRGAPDALSSLILEDAADALEMLTR